MKKEKPIFSQNLFWDIDIEELDVDKYPKFVIERVIERGSLEDWHKVKNYYTFEQIKELSLTMRCLAPTALTFIAAYLNLPITEFRCYKLSQLMPQPWHSYEKSNP